MWQTLPEAYAEAACLFAWDGTPLATEALNAIGNDFATYPDLDAALAAAESDMTCRAIMAIMGIEAELGRDVPAALYNVMLAACQRDNPTQLMDMFKDDKVLMQDRLWDAVLHAALLVTPIGMFIQSTFSRYGLQFTHVMSCGCAPAEYPGAAFFIPLDEDLKPAYLQNMIAAALEQYGVNAATAGKARGF